MIKRWDRNTVSTCCRADTAVPHARSPTDFSLNTVVYAKSGTRKPAPPNFFNFLLYIFRFLGL